MDDLFESVIIKQEYNIQEPEVRSTTEGPGHSSRTMNKDDDEESMDDGAEGEDDDEEDGEEDSMETEGDFVCGGCGKHFRTPSRLKDHISKDCFGSKASASGQLGRKRPQKYQARYTKEMVFHALEAIRQGSSVRQASKQFQIPCTTLRNRLSGKTTSETMGKRGYHSVLGKEIEEELAKWITDSNERGLFVSKDGVYASIDRIIIEKKLQREDVFKNKKPSKMWIYSFRNRHPEMIWMHEKFTRADKLTDAAVKCWLRDVDNQLGEHSKILACPERVFSVEVLSFGLPEKYDFVLSNPKKEDVERVTTIFSVNANGVFAPPQTLYNVEIVPVKAFELAPLGWKIGMTKSGYMTPAAFYDYFTTIFLRFLADNKIQRPVIVYIDGQKSNLTFHLKKFCDEQKILLVPLCPDASHILHPLNVTLFETVRKEWISTKADMEDGKFTFLTKYNLPAMLNMFMTMDGRKEALIESFKTTGLRPLNSDFVPEVPENLTHKVPEVFEVFEVPEEPLREQLELDVNILRAVRDRTEQIIRPDLLAEFQKTKAAGTEWMGEIESTRTLGRNKKSVKRKANWLYTQENMTQALQAVKAGMPIRQAACQFKVPRTTLRNKISGKSPLECIGHGGLHSVLGKKIEDQLVAWINESNERGMYISRDGFLASVERIINEEKLPNKILFKNKKPSKAFLYHFRKRHPELVWIEEYIKPLILTDAAVKHWLMDVDKQLGENSKILACPERVFSVELLVFGLRENEQILSYPKKFDIERVTTIFAANANGIFMAPQTFYKAERMSAKMRKQVPPGWKIGKTESGNMTPSAFYDYFKSTFVTFLTDNKVQRPVIVYIDGQKTNLTFHLKKFCDEQKILLVPLCHDASHILHPLNVTLFETVRKDWLSTTADIGDTNTNFMTKYNLQTMLNMIMTMDGRKEDLIDKFKTTGLRPLKSDYTSEVPQSFEVHQASSTTTMTKRQSKALESVEVDYEDHLPNTDFVPEDPEDELPSNNFNVPQVPQSSQHYQAPEMPETPSMKILELGLGALESYLSFFEQRLKPSLLSQFRATKASQTPWKGKVESTDLYNMWKGIVMDIQKTKNKIRVNYT
ncbi:uncharacterized protein DMENIID0001_103710 [Sergentomyia squamirostris]